MLDRILKNALEGITVIEDESGGVGKILARQLAGYGRTAGKKVATLSLENEERSGVETTRPPGNGHGSGTGIENLRAGGAGVGVGSQAYGKGQKYLFLEGLSQDIVIVDSFATFLFDKSDKEVVDLVRQMVRLVRQQKKSFIIPYDKGLLSERAAAYLRTTADTVVIVKVEITSDKVTRMLYIPKLRDARPMDRLIKITVDQSGIQVDTREFVG